MILVQAQGLGQALCFLTVAVVMGRTLQEVLLLQ
jgi:hypothetical protein